MLNIVMNVIEDAHKQSSDIKLNNYHLYSSIFEPTPKLSFSYSASYITPDALSFFIGTSFPIQYQFIKNVVEKTIESVDGEEITQTKNSEEKTDLEDLAGLVVSDVEMEDSSTGTKTTVTCLGEFDFFQNSNIRKAYTSKYGNDIVEDILDANNIMQSYDRNIQKTDNSTTIYRSLGDSDIDFIQRNLYNKYTISNGKPLLFTGLDRKINFTSINNLLESNQKSKILINLPSASNDDLSETLVKDKLKNYLDETNYVNLTAANYSFHLGAKNSAFNLQNAVYYTSYENGLTTTNGYLFKPALSNKQYFPINRFFTTFSKATQAVATYNRPSSNIVYESRDYFDSFENLITIQVKITSITALQYLVLAGDFATVLTTYPYSIYNGNYLIAAVEYGQEETTTFMELTLIRPTVDMTWQDLLTSNKDSDEFKFPFAPTLQKSMLYSI